MAHRRSFRGTRTPRRKKSWVQATSFLSGGAKLQPLIVVPQLVPAFADEFTKIVDFFTAGSVGEGKVPSESTVLRIRGQLTLAKSNSINTAVTAFGIAVIDNLDLAINTDSLPGPLSAPNWDGWMFIRGPSDQASVDVESTRYDVKAMRKIEGGANLAFVTEYYTVGTTVSDDPPVLYTARVLLALP